MKGHTSTTYRWFFQFTTDTNEFKNKYFKKKHDKDDYFLLFFTTLYFFN